MATEPDALSAYVPRLTAQATGPIEVCTELSVDDLWSRHGPVIWKADRFVGSPHFYPVYKCDDLYSYSLIALIIHKGGLRLNRRVGRQVSQPGFLYYSGHDTIDRDITRVGGPPPCGFIIRSQDDYARQIADALRHDIAAIESQHAGYTNIILCGGKDSCNLLLLPWKNPVVVVSAPPNYELVRGFVAANGLRLDVVELTDHANALLPVEVLVNCCRNNLEHCRWGDHLQALSRAHGKKVIFWKGQAGDVLTTPAWRRFGHPTREAVAGVSPLRQALAARRRRRISRVLEATTLSQRLFFRSLWSRVAMSLGPHMALIRQLTDALVLSAYHGPAMRSVLSQVDLHRAVQSDIRPLVGNYLLGRPVTYPSTNPGPPLSTQRRNASHLAPFLQALTAAGIPISR